MSFSIVITVYNEYELLRQLIESILINVDPATYKEIIIIDDYSDTKGQLRAYENYLKAAFTFIKVINFPESRPTVYTWSNQINIDGTDFSTFDRKNKGGMGPVMAAKLGLLNVETDYAMKVDTDVIFLKKAKNMFREMEECFRKYNKARCIGQIFGRKMSEIGEIEKAFAEETRTSDMRYPRGGFPGPTAYACRMSGFHDDNILMLNPCDPLKVGAIQGWEHTVYIEDLFKKGFSTCNFPLYSQGYILHLGGGTVKNLVGRKIYNKILGYCKDFKGRYGGRLSKDSLWDWYCGYYIINMNSAKYLEHIKKKYAAPNNQLQPTVEEENLIVDVEGKQYGI